MERLAGKIMLVWGFPRAAVALLAGAIGALALPPFGFFAVLFISFPVLVWLIDGATGNAHGGWLARLRSTFWIGWLFGFGYFVASLWWLGNALLVDADEFAWALPLAVLGLPAYLALFYGLAVAIAGLVWSDGLGRIAAIAFGFGIGEWLRSFVATGFPWNAIGYGAMPIPLMMQSSAVLGIFGVSVLAVFVFSAPALIGTRTGMKSGLALAAILFIAHLGYGAWRLNLPVAAHAEDAPVVRIVQPMIDQSRKLDDAERAAVFEEHLSMSVLPPQEEAGTEGGTAGRRPDIIVWPETAVPFIITQNPDALVRIADVLKDGQVLIAGAVRAEDAGAGFAPRFYNSIYVIDAEGQIVSAADKVHLVPFGEYVPYEDLLRSIGMPDAIAMPGGFTAASARTMLTLPGGRSFYPLICYEAIFPDEIAAGAAGTDALLNVTNDGWFGATPGPYQHFQQARIRAVETSRPLIRAANTGISAVVDPFGRIIRGLAYNQKGVIDTTLRSVFVSHWDDFSRQIHFWLVALSMLVIAMVSRTGFNFRTN